jgi:hypothetical protein
LPTMITLPARTSCACFMLGSLDTLALGSRRRYVELGNP